MHIDFGNLTIETESNVEQKVLMPLLQGEAYLGIPERNLHKAVSRLDGLGQRERLAAMFRTTEYGSEAFS